MKISLLRKVSTRLLLVSLSVHLWFVFCSSEVNGQTVRDILSTPVLPSDSANAILQRFLTSRFEPLRTPGTKEKWEEHASLRINSLRELLTAVPLQKQNPISIKPNGVLRSDGFHIEKYLVEVYRGFEISLNLYRPDVVIGRVPLVINPNGFYLEGKAHEEIQARCVNFAKMGYIAAAWDFVHTGERGGWNQVGLPENNTYYSLWWRLTGVNSLPMTIGETKSILDYLLSLPMVDPMRVAAVGSSQGGLTSLLAAAIDPRIKVVVAASLSEPYKQMPFNTTGQFLEESWFHWEGSFTSELMNYVSDVGELLRFVAPRPVLVISGMLDTPGLVSGIEREIKGAVPIYSLYNQENALRHDSVSMHHEFNSKARLLAYAWVRRWLEGDTTSVRAEFSFAPWPLDSLRCGVRPGNMTILSAAHQFAGSIRQNEYNPLSPAEATETQKRIRDLLTKQIHPMQDSIVGERGFRISDYEGGLTASGTIEYASGLCAPTITFQSRLAKLRTGILLISDSGKSSVDPALVDGLTGMGYTVCAADLFGMGEMRFRLFSERVTSFYLEMFGLTSAGIACSEVETIVDYLSKKYGLTQLILIANGVQSQLVSTMVAKHNLIHGIVINGGLDAYQVEQPETFPSRIPPICQYKGSFQHDDLSFISALAAPKPLLVTGLKSVDEILLDSNNSQTSKRVKGFYKAFSKRELFCQAKNEGTEIILSWIGRHYPGHHMQTSSLKLTNSTASTAKIEMIEKPTTYGVKQNYPNPFNPSTAIQFDLPVQANVTLDVYDLLGNRIAQLLDEDREPGYHSVMWESPDDVAIMR